MENANAPGLDIEDLTPEQLDERIYCQLNTQNPQAPHNLTKYSYKDRIFSKEDAVDQMVVLYSVDGDILLTDSDEYRDQEEYIDTKRRKDKQMLDKMNAAIKEENIKLP